MDGEPHVAELDLDVAGAQGEQLGDQRGQAVAGGRERRALTVPAHRAHGGR